MNILLVCYENIAGNNGGIRQVMALAENLQTCGHTVAVCAPRIQKRADPQVPILYIPVINIPHIRYISYMLLSVIFLPFIMNRFKPQAVLYFMIHLNFCAPFYWRIKKCPFILFVNGIITEEKQLRSSLVHLTFPFLTAVYRYTIRSARHVLTVTNTLKQHIAETGTIDMNNISIVPAGVDTGVFVPRDRTITRRELRLPERGPIIGFHGSLFPWHGVDYLFDAAPLIIRAIPDVLFLIVGKGTMLSLLKHTAEKKGFIKNVLFTGTVSFDRIPLYVSSFDLGICFFKPVRSDPGNPIKMYEYLASEVPVVASDVPGYGDFIESIGAGVRLNAADPKHLADAVIALLKDRPLRERMGTAGRREVIKQHTWLHRARAISSLIDRSSVGSNRSSNA